MTNKKITIGPAPDTKQLLLQALTRIEKLEEINKELSNVLVISNESSAKLRQKCTETLAQYEASCVEVNDLRQENDELLRLLILSRDELAAIMPHVSPWWNNTVEREEITRKMKVAS